MLFFSFFKTLVDKEIRVELKNGIEITGTLKSIDQYLNLKLDNIKTTETQEEEIKYPHLIAVRSLFIRGSMIRYIHLSPLDVDTSLLQDAARREAIATSGDKLAGR